MVCRQRDNAVQACAPQRADESLTECIGLGALGRRFEDPESKMVYVLVELLGENAVAVMQQEAVAMGSGDGFAQLLERPLGCGMGRHIAVQNAARGMLHHDKHVEQTKGGCDHQAKVTRDDRLGMIAH